LFRFAAVLPALNGADRFAIDMELATDGANGMQQATGAKLLSQGEAAANLCHQIFGQPGGGLVITHMKIRGDRPRLCVEPELRPVSEKAYGRAG
jgi:hypothetical protein